MKKILKKGLILLTAFMLSVTGLPFSGLSGIEEAEAAPKSVYRGELVSKRLLEYDMASSKFMQIYYAIYDNLTIDIGSCSESGSPMHTYSVDIGEAVEPIVYCAEHGVAMRNTTNLGARVAEDSELWRSYRNADKEYAMENILDVLYFAPVERSSSELFELGFGESDYYFDNASRRSDYDFAAWVAATQCLVWECQQDMRDEKFTRHANGLSYQTSWHGATTSKIPADHYIKNIKGTPAMDIYNFMASEVKRTQNIDATIASSREDKPAEVVIPSDAELPYTKEIKGSKSGCDYIVVDDKGKKVKGVEISFDEATKKYSVKVSDEDVLNKTLTIRRNDAPAVRARKYLEGENKKIYRPYVWAYSISGGEHHTQSFISGLTDPPDYFLKITKGASEGGGGGEGGGSGGSTTELEYCTPPDAEVFPVVRLPIEKIDLNAGFDGDTHTPMGDAALSARVRLERQIDGGAWEVIDSKQFDDFGTELDFLDQPFKQSADLDEFLSATGVLTECDHPVYDDEGNLVGYEHNGSKRPTHKEWDVTVNYRITVTRPDGRYIDPDKYGGVREYTFSYHAESEDTCEYWCHGDEWVDVEYSIDYSCTTGDGAGYSISGTKDEIGEEPELTYDLETDVEDVFRGRFLLIKSNEKENPFKDSALGGSESNMSKKTEWTIRLKSKGFEGSEYIHLVSDVPKKLGDGTNVYTVSREPGVINSEENPVRVGTNGALLIEDLPYGEYIVTEVGTDDPMYVAEQFVVTVSEHNAEGEEILLKPGERGSVPLEGLWSGYDKSGTNEIGGYASGTGDFYNNLYQVNLRDKIKGNRIKLQKVDSETGKVIRLSGTKVFIRYKGNPDYSDSENEKRYGKNGTEAKDIYNRFLPNAESINSRSTNYTFELDENGCFDILYELPYGIYEIYEWMLPEGYYVGEYDNTGAAKSHNFGFVSEGQFTVEQNIHGFDGTVPSYAIRDANGNKVKYMDEDSYSFENLTDMITNRYTFTVTKQNMHIDGNYSELVTYGGNLRTDADPAYEKTDFPFENYYKIVAVMNNRVRGSIEIHKEGEALTGFIEEEKDGFKVLTAVFEPVVSLDSTVFGIYAAEDINLSDGSEGAAIYDSKTDERLDLALSTSSHLSNAAEKVTAFSDTLKVPKEYTASNYDVSELSIGGGKLWSMLERAASQNNIKRTIYVTPEQKDTVYEYTFTTSDEVLNYTYIVRVNMQNKAGGDNVTGVNIRKITETKTGYVPFISTSHMTGSVGEKVLDPIDNYMDFSGNVDPNLISALEAQEGTYIYQADGEVGNNEDVATVDFSDIGARRYVVRDYTYYRLTSDDLKTEERKVGEMQVIDVPGIDSNGDGDYDDPGDTLPITHMEDILETRTMFEWENEGYELVGAPAEGDIAVLKEIPRVDEEGESAGTTETEEPKYKTAVTGYYAAINEADFEREEAQSTVRYTKLTTKTVKYTFIESDETGSEIIRYELPKDFAKESYTKDPKKEPQYIIASKTDAQTAEVTYMVLLDDMTTWQVCDENGNFVKRVVQDYDIKYTQAAKDKNGFSISWDDFSLSSFVDDENAAITEINKHSSSVNQNIDLGAGYEYTDEGANISFRTIPISSPIYFMWSDGVKADAYYKGGVCYATVTLSQSAVDHLYENIVPTLCFRYTDGGGKDVNLRLDWYKELTPENATKEFSVLDGLPTGCKVKVTRTDAPLTGGESEYLIEIITSLTEEKPLTLTFADDYTMDIYCVETLSGNGAGVIELYNVYKTTKYTKGELVDTVNTDEKGNAVSKLLPLGKYVVRELDTKNEYVNDEEGRTVEISYENQFTPVVYTKTSFDNEYMSVELDLSKVFETAFASGTYEKPKEGQEVLFGLYAAEAISAKESGKASISKKSLEEGDLIDVIKISYADNGRVLVSSKLPKGLYYIKEISTDDNYLLSDVKYIFAVDEKPGAFTHPSEFEYAEEGISGKLRLIGKNTVETVIEVENRLPMPSIIVDEKEYMLDKDYPLAASGTEATSEEGTDNVTVKRSDDITTITVLTSKALSEPSDSTVETSITLPNGKVLFVKLNEGGNSYSYELEAAKETYTGVAAYTGYYTEYSELFEPVAGEDLTNYAASFTLTGAGADKEKVLVKANISHTPVFTDVKTNELIDPENPSLGYRTVPKGTLNASGDQVFTHSAKISVKDNTGLNAFTDFVKTDSKGKSEPWVFGGEALVLNAKESIVLTTNTGARVCLSMDKFGSVTASIENMLSDGFDDSKNSEVTTDGKYAADKTFKFSKNVTLMRQDAATKTMLVKVNSDNKDGFAIENEHKPLVKFVKVDSEKNEKKLSGAIFEIWSSKESKSDEWRYEPDKKLGEFTTDRYGEFSTILDYGIYFYRELKAPNGYEQDYKFHEFKVFMGRDEYTFTVENVKKPDVPSGGGGYVFELVKIDSENGSALSGAIFEIYASHMDENGNLVRDDEPLLTNLETGRYGRLIARISHSGTYYYHEVKAPDGYVCDEQYYEFMVGSDTPDIYTVTMENGKEGSTLVLNKISTKGKPLSGAEFEIWTAKKVGGKYTKGEIVTTAVTDEDGKITVDGLKLGTYYYHEAKAPDGYVTDDKWHLFKIQKDGETLQIDVVNKKAGLIEVYTDIHTDEESGGNAEIYFSGSVPKTGDEMNLWLFIGIMLPLSGLILTLLRRKAKS